MVKDGLTYTEDVRNRNPTGNHLGNFKKGWKNAVEGQEYEAVLDELKWNNLGWRLGKLFGETSEESKEHIFNWCRVQINQIQN